MAGEPVLAVDGLDVVFPSHDGPFTALKDVSIEVFESDIVVLVGPSGCGKSTLLNTAAGLIYPSAGEIRVDGEAVVGPGRDRGMVFQAYTLYPWLRVQANVEYGMKLNKVRSAERRRVAEHYLKLVGLADAAGRYPHQLSGGMRQRVAIARALANEPRVLLMDEPFGALDAQTRVLMQQLLLDVWERSKMTILFVTHDIEEAVFLGDRIYVMDVNPGRIATEIEVDIPRPRHFEVIATDRFQAKRQVIFDLIRREHASAEQIAIDALESEAGEVDDDRA
ncbi:MAG: ABC transporter ATP-binding protein [Actinomycetota bacterium]